jgi:hypothetical protein
MYIFSGVSAATGKDVLESMFAALVLPIVLHDHRGSGKPSLTFVKSKLP